MSQAFPYIQSARQKHLYDHYINGNKPIDRDLEITTVVANFLSWDETGGLGITLTNRISSR